MNKKLIGIMDILVALFDIVMIVIDIQTGQYVFAVILGILASILFGFGFFFVVSE